MFENPSRGRQARNFGKNVPKILDLKSSSEQIFSENCRWVPGAPDEAYTCVLSLFRRAFTPFHVLVSPLGFKCASLELGPRRHRV